jgi:HD-GYP domain-containing protein (c-di-GMP phosphodiesterase class II)
MKLKSGVEYMTINLVPVLHRQMVKNEREFLKLIRQLSETKNDLNDQVLANQKLIEGIVNALNIALEAKDRFTQGHSERVSSMSAVVAKRMGLSSTKCEQVRLAGLFHDIGKIGISDSILLSKGSLTDEEYNEIKMHPIYSVKILEPVDPFGMLLKGMLYHHENWDGSGYPEGLSKESIPMPASIIHVVDSFDAMTSERTYRKPMIYTEALAELHRYSGIYYHPGVVDCFCQCFAQREHKEFKMA